MYKDIKNLLNTESEQLSKLHYIVSKSIEDENLIINNLLNPPKEILTRGQKISDKVARFGGSWAFIISFFIVLVIWILFNTLSPKGDNFDPYPFILMNLILSCIAALQAPVIMMSQNRQEEKDRLRSENDYMVNLKAELEIRSLHQKIDLLLEEQIKVLFDSQAKQLEILKNIEHKLAVSNPAKKVE
ncbi:DUF1003 domain-containing protein [Lacihabitans sp. LS3-19]|uniref:DUF1003 domain-containing protein n=1 Tax=Lacihabitans sp. LS3-19 TaxID=2487335 RepID=UPI0020CD2373|nr:DUF1003 domain-containing protein [Lacihabitans sp. LS3-19]MCP9768949.1 DUF1003 domain-containing protein [Lacihabitans sp. LS3-19]